MTKLLVKSLLFFFNNKNWNLLLYNNLYTDTENEDK